MSTTSLKIGSVLRYQGKEWRIRKVPNLSEIMIEDVRTKALEIVPVSTVFAHQEVLERPTKPLETLAADDLAEAHRRLEIIRPIVSCQRGRQSLTEAIALQNGIGASTLRRWVHAYLDRGLLSDLAPARKGRVMPKKLDKRVEALVAKVIDDRYLNMQQRSIRKAYLELKRQVKAAKLIAPHESTFRERIQALPESLKVRRRYGKKEARDRFDPVRGAFPGADCPLGVAQIDHTMVDIIIVDDERREPIGRPWLTLAIDVFSRMIVGYYLSLDAPSAFSVGLCLYQAADRKEADLQRLGIEGEWPVWGLARTIHADNGKDFRSRMIQDACDQYGIHLEWRPVKTPHYGGHIERLMGTVATEIHDLPGTTFANIKARKEYKSEKAATMTFHELERWLVQFIVNVYHQRKHGGIGMAPLERWRQGIMGHGRTPGIGLPDPVLDPHRLRRDLLPSEKRSVGPKGIVWDKVYYYGDALRPWIGARKGGVTSLFTVRRDPRDISKLYFLDPELKDYLEIPYHDTSKPSVSIWEYRAAENYLRVQGKEADNEDVIFAALEEMARTVDNAKTETKRVRRARQRKKLHSVASDMRGEASVTQLQAPVRPKHLNLVVDNGADDSFDIPEYLGEIEEV